MFLKPEPLVSAIGKWWRLPFILALMLPGSVTHAVPSFDEFKPPRKIAPALRVSAVPDPQKILPGQTFLLHVLVQLEKGWHIYSIRPQDENKMLATRLELKQNVFQADGDWSESKPRIILDQALKKVVKTHARAAEFTRSYRVPENIQPGIFPVSGVIIYRACDNKVCTLPKEISFATRVHVLEGRDTGAARN